MTIKEHDSIILYIDDENIELVKLEKDKQITNKKGIFLHNDIIGKEYGYKIFDTLSRNYIYPLRLSQELIALSLKKNTQVLFEHDISFICLLCNAIPNKRIVEAGTGSGCLTYALTNAVLPNGKVFTFEYNEERYKHIKKQFENFEQIRNNVQFFHDDIITNGFDESFIGTIDSVFLDIPNPWMCVEKVKKILKERGIFVIFLPCIEQVQKVINQLELHSFCEIITYELINKSWKIIPNLKKTNSKAGTIVNGIDSQTICNENNTKPIEENQSLQIPAYRLIQKENKTHTGYITVARKPLNDEEEQMEIEVKNFIE